MEDIENKIEEHKNKIKILNEKIGQTKDINEQLILNIQIKAEQDIIITLLEIKNKNDFNQKEIKEEIKENIEDKSNKCHINKYEQKTDDNNKEHNLLKDIKKNNGKIKNTDIKEQKFELDFDQLKEVNPDNITNFNYYFKNEDLLTKYIINKKSKYNIYYYCSKKRNGCPGSIKYIINNNNWEVINKCDIKIIHDTIKYEDFYNDYIENNLNKYNMEILKFQKYYIRSLYKSNDNIEITNIKSNFRNRFNIKLKLTKEDIYKEKYIVLGNINKLNLLELCNKISTTDIKVNCKSVDIFYEYKNKKIFQLKEKKKLYLLLQIKWKQN